MSRRVVVTGVGLVSPVGMGTQANWDALCASTSGIGPITRFDAAAFSTRFAGEVKNFDPLQFIEKKELKKVDIFIQFAIAASQFAMDDARLTITPDVADRVGVFIGSGIGGFNTIEREHKAYLDGGPRKISPFLFPPRSSTWRRDRSRFAMAPRARTWRPAPRARRRRMRSAIRSRSSSAAQPMP